MSMIRVLIVDDSTTIRALMQQVLESDPHIRVTGVAASAEEARQMFRTSAPDVVTLDIEMPGMSGLDYLQELVSDYPLPVIMLSGRTAQGETMRAQALSLGAAACFNKADTLRERVALIKLIKAAAGNRLRLNAEDRVAAKQFHPPQEGAYAGTSG